MIRSVVGVVVLGALFALGTYAGGWWTIPLVAACGGVVLGASRRPGIVAGLAGLSAWAAILIGYRFAGLPVDVLARRLAGAMQLPTWGLITVTLLFPALLAAAAAALGGQLRTNPGRLR